MRSFITTAAAAVLLGSPFASAAAHEAAAKDAGMQGLSTLLRREVLHQEHHSQAGAKLVQTQRHGAPTESEQTSTLIEDLAKFVATGHVPTPEEEAHGAELEAKRNQLREMAQEPALREEMTSLLEEKEEKSKKQQQQQKSKSNSKRQQQEAQEEASEESQEEDEDEADDEESGDGQVAPQQEEQDSGEGALDLGKSKDPHAERKELLLQSIKRLLDHAEDKQQAMKDVRRIFDTAKHDFKNYKSHGERVPTPAPAPSLEEQEREHEPHEHEKAKSAALLEDSDEEEAQEEEDEEPEEKDEEERSSDKDDAAEEE
mmetsp:Transcript_16188/g.35052  ORF Transcript_16188/g.35052 Transcript_16188/m.35052 type:complete len:315 (+) Transcript_16188:158-1102(+)|eukprot:CAMPEP_0194757608 /NCGR_PEP_ID=MMETSP0323_2-20130528/11074_1 /TAXON_ID=2866 ORGANISM="Crypthecodinium cohnii, Strain Seligo" /NCGR_SAMPLE_ID=MMETSP0323_2 /ASSEMBLY_ACC=CAM_ASM_000346 /LENGTH=314 /DNA_ID=CAMNT_0039677621 /DNA_START=29 /DNA_END=973 /DNA_ORIENTATION=+